MEKLKTIRVVTISALFPELKGARCHQQGRGRGSNWKAAAGAAIRDLLGQRKLKAQRFTTATATFSFGTIAEETLEAETQQHPAQPLS